MKRIVVSVRDNVLGMYFPPYYAVNEAAAVRDFRSAINSDAEQVRNYMDLMLYRLGEFDDESGDIVPNTPFLLTTGSNCKEL